MTREDKLKLINKLLTKIEKNYGSNIIVNLNKRKMRNNINFPVFRTGSIILDRLTGINGLPKGGIIEIFGPESSGKTTLGLTLISSIHKLSKDSYAAFIDVEHAFNINYAKNVGIDLDRLLFCQPDTGEQALSIMKMLIISETVDIIILDSVAALAPEAELKGEMEDQTIGLQARLMSKFLRQLNPFIMKTKTAVIFINQIRNRINSFGNPETTPGGKALRFYSTIRLEIKFVKKLLENNIYYGNMVKLKIVKNKLAVPFKEDFSSLIFNKGFCLLSEILDLSIRKNIILQNGGWYSYENKKLGRKQDCFKFLTDNNNEKLEFLIKKFIV